MVKFVSAVSAFIFLTFVSLGQEPQSNLRTNEILGIEQLAFSFENYNDSLTLEALDQGEVTVSWERFSDKGYDLTFRYRTGSENWTELKAKNTESEFRVSNLTENLIFQYEFANCKNCDWQDSSIKKVSGYFNTFSSSLFENNSSKGKIEGVVLYWAIPVNTANQILAVYPTASYSLTYNTAIGADQHKSNAKVSPWTVLDDISINTVSHKIEPLIGGEKYAYKIGLNLGDQIIWSKKSSFTTERPWGLFKFLILIGSLGLFIFGMKIMSEGLQKVAGSGLRNMLGKITSNRFKGVITGLGITSVVQSSSVTTVMTVSFVNAGLMTLKQAAGVMMGANIGTTLTAWLILVFGFKVDISGYALALVAIGAPMLFFTKGTLKLWASVIIGFAILFMGLGFLKDSVPGLSVDSPLVQFFIDYKNSGVFGTLMFIGLGTLITIIIQSSSAAMALTMTMVAGGLIPFEVAAAMILGENIGTTVTAQLAALIGNVHAKRAARLHAFFNLIGVFWCVLVFHTFLNGIAYFMEGDPFKSGEAANFGLAVFHTAFNTANVLLLVWFTPWLVKLAEKSVRSKGSADEEFHLDYIGTGIMGTPDLSTMEAKKEVAKFGEITSRMSGFTQKLLTERNKKARALLHSKIEKYEEITDRVEIEVANYLAQVSSGEMTAKTAQQIRAMNNIVNDLERIGDIFYQMSKTIEKKNEDKLYFLPEQRSSLLEMFKFVDTAFDIMVENLQADWDEVKFQPALSAENKINEQRDVMRKEHLENLGKEGNNMLSDMVFNNLFSSCEKIGDHIINVTEAITGNIE